MNTTITKKENFKIYVANLGAYNRGYLIGKWLSLPMSEDKLNEAIEDILNGEEAIKSRDEDDWDEETAIHDYECDFIEIGEYDSIEKLNELAGRFEALHDWEQETLKAIFEVEDETDFDLIDSIYDYNLIPDINNEYDLGYYYLEESGLYDIPKFLRNYIDYEAFGRDITFDGRGNFTSYGWLEKL